MTNAELCVAGHHGLAGSAIARNLLASGVRPGKLILRKRAGQELAERHAVDEFFALEPPTQVYLAAARMGSIHANNSYPEDFIRDNLVKQTNVIHAAHGLGVAARHSSLHRGLVQAARAALGAQPAVAGLN